MRSYQNSGVKVVRIARSAARQFLAPVASAASGMLGGRQDNIGGKASQRSVSGVRGTALPSTAKVDGGVLAAAGSAENNAPVTRVPLGTPGAGLDDGAAIIAAVEQDAIDRETAGENFHG